MYNSSSGSPHYHKIKNGTPEIPTILTIIRTGGTPSAIAAFGAMPLTGPSPLIGPIGPVGRAKGLQNATGLLNATGPWDATAELAPPRAGGLLNAAGPCDAIADEVPKKGGGTAVSKKGSEGPDPVLVGVSGLL